MQELFTTAKDARLVYDVGLHHGQDTDYYLKKGYRVVAFEADPKNAAFCRERFADAIRDGRLTIVEGAITEAPRSAEVKFYRNEDHSLWGSTNEEWAARNRVMGTTNEVIRVPAVDLVECLLTYGVPHYLKADIVGSETICLRALLRFENKPDYISIRSEKLVWSNLEYEFELLRRLGYDRFKAIKQDFGSVHPRIGDNSYSFEEGASGPFGPETPGNWQSAVDTIGEYRRVFVKYWLFGDYSYLQQTERGRRFVGLLERLTRRSIPGWYDTHAVHSSVADDVSPVARPATSLKQQSAWLLAAKIIGFAFSFVLPLLIVRHLEQEQVGHYREAFQVITNAVIILPLGFSMSAYYFLARERERRGAAIFNILLFNFIVGGLACLGLYLYPQVLGSIFQTETMTQLAPKIGVVIWIWIFSTFLETVAIANQEARVATAFIVLAQLSKTALMAAAVFAFASVEAFIWAAMVQGVIQTAILLSYLRSRFPRFWTQFDIRFFWEQMRYAVPFGLTGILWIAQNDIHNYFVGYKFSSSDFAIYAYGCFEIPLIAMLAESVTSVLIPRMNELQQRGDRDEMIRLTARAMQKLAFFYFPIYVFMMITAQTFIITLFTEKYAASASVFVINLTILPFSILITDPIVRSYKELGRLFLLTRIFVLTCLIGVLYWGLGSFGLQGMIITAVAAVLIEKWIAEMLVIRTLGLGLQHLPLLKDVGKTAVAALAAGVITYFVYNGFHVYALNIGEALAAQTFSTTKLSTLNFIGGGLVLGICAAVFLPTYLLAANILGIIDEGEKAAVRRVLRRLTPIGRRPAAQGI